MSCRKLVLFVVPMLLVALSPACAGGNTWRSPEAFNPTGAPFQLLQAPAASLKSGIGTGGLSVRYAIHNTSKETLTRLGIEVLTFFPSGQVKGFHVFTMKTRIAPGETVFGTYASAQYHVAPGDRLVMVPYSASGAALRWTMDRDDLAAVSQSLEAAAGDASSAGMVSLEDRAAGPPQNQYPPGDPGGSTSCLTTCQSAASQCESTCKCGVSSTSCTCNADGSLTTSCSCFQCPKPPA
jgi:hypothetical protein